MADSPVERANRLSAEIAAFSERGAYARAVPLAAQLCDLVRDLVGDTSEAYAAALDQRAPSR